MLNKVIQIGNLTRDPELRVLQNGSSVCTFTLAVNSSWEKEPTLFLDVSAWNKTGETCQKFLKKGSKVAIDGRLKLEKWVDQLGVSKSKISAVAENVRFLNHPNNQDEQQSATQNAQASSQEAEPVNPPSVSESKPPIQKQRNEPEGLSEPNPSLGADEEVFGEFPEDIPF